MTCKLVTVTAGVVYRIGRAPNPWALPDWRYAHADGTFGNRWDDPSGVYRVGYASSQRRGTFVETLSRFRPDPKITATPPSDQVIDALIMWMGGTATSPQPGTLDVRTWTSTRMIGTGEPDGLFADVAHSVSMAEMTSDLAALLISLGLTEMDGATLRSPDRSLTQQISKYIFSCASDAPGGWAGNIDGDPLHLPTRR